MKLKCQISFLGITLTILLMGCATSVPAKVTEGTPLTSGEHLPPPQSISSSPINQGQMLPISAQAQMADSTIMLEVARTPQEQAMGLMYRTELAPDHGMLFAFDPPQPVGFWMKNTLIPLDMVFLRAGEVKAISANVPPCTTPSCPTYGPQGLIDQVIELRGGRAGEIGLKVGDQVKIQFQNIKTPPSPSPQS